MLVSRLSLTGPCERPGVPDEMEPTHIAEPVNVSYPPVEAAEKAVRKHPVVPESLRWLHCSLSKGVLVNKKILLFAALLSVLNLCAYLLPFGSYLFWSKVALIGFPGLVVAVVLSSALRGGGHGGGPLGEMLLISTVINFVVYAGLGIAAQSLWKVLNKRDLAGRRDIPQ